MKFQRPLRLLTAVIICFSTLIGCDQQSDDQEVTQTPAPAIKTPGRNPSMSSDQVAALDVINRLTASTAHIWELETRIDLQNYIRAYTPAKAVIAGGVMTIVKDKPLIGLTVLSKQYKLINLLNIDDGTSVCINQNSKKVESIVFKNPQKYSDVILTTMFVYLSVYLDQVRGSENERTEPFKKTAMTLFYLLGPREQRVLIDTANKYYLQWSLKDKTDRGALTAGIQAAEVNKVFGAISKNADELKARTKLLELYFLDYTRHMLEAFDKDLNERKKPAQVKR